MRRRCRTRRWPSCSRSASTTSSSTRNCCSPTSSACSPASRCCRPTPGTDEVETTPAPLTFTAYDGGIHEIGHAGNGFSFDNEGPRHRALLQPFALADRLVTNGEWLAFMRDGGYRDAALWLADGWGVVKAQGWDAPLYWEERDGAGGR